VLSLLWCECGFYDDFFWFRFCGLSCLSSFVCAQSESGEVVTVVGAWLRASPFWVCSLVVIIVRLDAFL
jgi:hypothetical protein